MEVDLLRRATYTRCLQLLKHRLHEPEVCKCWPCFFAFFLPCILNPKPETPASKAAAFKTRPLEALLTDNPAKPIETPTSLKTNPKPLNPKPLNPKL